MIAAVERTASGVPVPSWWGVALSLMLIAVAGAVAMRERLGLTRDLALATVRAAVQLVAVGAVLRLVFEHTGIPGSLGWVGGMVVLAGGTAARRGRGLPHVRAIGTAAIAVAVVGTLGLLLGGRVITAEPKVVVPIGGMVVSAAMQVTSVLLIRLRDEIAGSRALIEARLALGLPARDAFAPHLRAALRNALAPAIDQTKVVGLIALPGAMTGLIIAGVPPLLAIRYQIVVMYMWLGAGALAGAVVAQLAARAFFDDAHRLRSLDAA